MTPNFWRRTRRWLGWISLALLALVMSIVGTIGGHLMWVQNQAPNPMAIVVLGGDFEREYFAADFAQNYPQLPVVISSGMPEPKSRQFFAQVGVGGDRLVYDHQAVDTLTNFTTLLPQLQATQIRHVYVITSDFHRARSRLIAYLIWGAHGIAYQFIAIPTQTPPEPGWLLLGDIIRTVVWWLTGAVPTAHNGWIAFLSGYVNF
ncbi:MAG: YdcF family protein [Spirulina sp. SIO3F2]|nr:YdcF family protein [Spirulina sp. SIO3F2]